MNNKSIVKIKGRYFEKHYEGFYEVYMIKRGYRLGNFFYSYKKVEGDISEEFKSINAKGYDQVL